MSLKNLPLRSLIGFGVIVVVLLVMLGVVACGTNPVASVAAGPTVTPLAIQLPTGVPVTPTAAAVARSANRSLATSIKANGTLLSSKQATLGFPVAGRMKEINVEEGNKVKVGTVLATLDTGSLEVQVMQAQAAFNLAVVSFNKVKAGPNADEVAIAKSNFDRAKAAVDQAQAAYDRIGGASNPFSGISPQALTLQQATSAFQAAIATFNLAVNRPTEVELGLAAAQLAQAQVTLEGAKVSLANARIVAPFDGTVIAINPKVGESIGANVAAVMLADLSKMQVIVNLDENSLVGIKLGQMVNLSVDALGGRLLTGKVRKVGLLGTATTGVVSVPVTIDIDPTDAPIYPGLSATVEFEAGQ